MQGLTLELDKVLSRNGEHFCYNENGNFINTYRGKKKFPILLLSLAATNFLTAFGGEGNFKKRKNNGIFLKLYFATLIAFFAIDMVWLGLVARSFYYEQLGFLLNPNTNWVAAMIFYLLFILGILVFVVLPGLKEKSLKATILRAALFGFVTYATYDLTNLATVKDWPLAITLVDLAWGTVLTIAVSSIGFLAGKRLAGN